MFPASRKPHAVFCSTALCAALAALPASAQTAPPTAPHAEIIGVVMEPGVNQPLADAEITISQFVRQPYKVTEVAKGKTDLQGAFRFTLDRLATYIVQGEKPGYSDGSGSLNGSSETVVIDKDHLVREVRFALVRTGELTGRVVDDDTGEPVSNFLVNVPEISYLHGEAIWSGGPVTPSDSEGRFVAPDRRPGNYLVQVGPQVLMKERLLTEFTGADRETVDHDYPNAYWPGGHGLDSASPVQIPSGGSVSAGTVRVKKAPFYRIHVSIPAGACAEGEKLTIITEMMQFQASAGGEVFCGKDFLLRDYQSGSYLLYVLSDAKAAHRTRVVVPFDVTDRNLDIKVPLTIGPDIDGRILLANGAKGPVPGTAKVSLRTADGPVQFSDEGRGTAIDDAGNFRFSEVPLARQRITVSGLGADYYVREIRYNGIVLMDNIFATDGASAAQSLEVAIDDRPATIAGTVTESDEPVAKPYVTLVRWPALPQSIFLAARSATGDDSGQFRFTGLAPGDYRILAVAQPAMAQLDEPGVLFRLLGNADTVTVDRGAQQAVPLKLTDPRR